MNYEVGQGVRIRSVFTSAGTETDPTGVTIEIKTPSLISTTYTYGTDAEVVKESTGIYYMDVTLSQAGVYRYHCTGTGAIIAADAGSITVNAKLT